MKGNPKEKTVNVELMFIIYSRSIFLIKLRMPMQSELSKEAIISPQNKARKLKEMLKVRSHATEGAADVITPPSQPATATVSDKILEDIQEAAVAYYQSALELEESYKTRSYELLREENRKERADMVSAALCHYNEAIKLCPDYFEAYYRRGNFLFILNAQLAFAKQDFEKAKETSDLALAAKASDLLKILTERVNRKWLEAKKSENPAEFVTACKEYLEICPDSYEANYFVAKFLLDSYLKLHIEGGGDIYCTPDKDAKNDYLKIIKHFKKAIELDPENPDPLYNLGRFYWYFMAEKSLEFFITNKKTGVSWRKATEYLSKTLEKNPSKVMIDSIYTMLLSVQLKECSQEEINDLLLLVERFYCFFEYFDIDQKMNFCHFLINFSNATNKIKSFEFHNIAENKSKLSSESYYDIYFEAYNYACGVCLTNSEDIDFSSRETLLSLGEAGQLSLELYKMNIKFQQYAAMNVLNFLWNIACFYFKKYRSYTFVVALLEKMIEIYDVYPFEFTDKNKQAVLCSALYQMADFYSKQGNDKEKVFALCERIFSLHKNGISFPLTTIMPVDNSVEIMNEVQVEVDAEKNIQEDVLEETIEVVKDVPSIDVDNNEIRKKAEHLCQDVIKIYSSTIDKNTDINNKKNKILSSLHKAKECDPSYGQVDYLFAKLFFYTDYIFHCENKNSKSKKLEEKIRAFLSNAISLDIDFSDKVNAYLLSIKFEMQSNQKEMAKKVYDDLKNIGSDVQYSEGQCKLFEEFRGVFEAQSQSVISGIQEEIFTREIAKKTNQISGERRVIIKNNKPDKAFNNKNQENKHGLSDISRVEALKRLYDYSERFKDKANKVKLDDFVLKIKNLIYHFPDLYEANLKIAESLLNYIYPIILSKINDSSSITVSEKQVILNYYPVISDHLIRAKSIQGDKIDVHYNLWRLYWYYDSIEMIREAVGVGFSSQAWQEAAGNCLIVLRGERKKIYVEEAVRFLFSCNTDIAYIDKHDVVMLIIQKIMQSKFFSDLDANKKEMLEAQFKIMSIFRLNFYKSCFDMANSQKKDLQESSFDFDQLRLFNLFMNNFKEYLSSPVNDQTFKTLAILMKEAFQILGEVHLKNKHNEESLVLFEKIISIQDFQSFPFHDREEASNYINTLRLCIIIKSALRHEDGMAKNYAMRIIEIYNDKALFADGLISEEDARDNNKIIYEVNMFLETGVWCQISDQVMGAIGSDDNQCDDIDQAIQDSLSARSFINNNSATVYYSGKSLQGSAQENSTLKNDEASNALSSYTVSMGSKK